MQSNSPSFSFNAIDWAKTIRFFEVQIVGGIVTFTIPWLLGFSYSIYGYDVTPFALIIINTAAEGLRRWYTNHSTSTTPLA